MVMRRKQQIVILQWLKKNTVKCKKLYARIHPDTCANEFLKARLLDMVGTACYMCPQGAKYALGKTTKDIRWAIKLKCMIPVNKEKPKTIPKWRKNLMTIPKGP